MLPNNDVFEGQLLVGLLVCLACIAVHSVIMAVVSWSAHHARQVAEPLHPRLRLVLVMGVAVSVLMAAHVIEVAIWGVAYAALQAVPKISDAFYFAFVNYTTLGYGDILPEPRWRLLGPITAMSGVLLFGWSTAVIYDVLRTIAQVIPAAAPERAG